MLAPGLQLGIRLGSVALPFIRPISPGGVTSRFRPLKRSSPAKIRVLRLLSTKTGPVLVSASSLPRSEAEERLDELAELARSDEVTVLGRVRQRLRRVNSRTLLGRGKLAEIMIRALRVDANLLIFDQELTPSQMRSITKQTDLRVIDRTQLILDIFARRARSREGKLQVEMAQLRYMLPRLSTRDDALSRSPAAFGARGPGETSGERRPEDNRPFGQAGPQTGIREGGQRTAAAAGAAGLGGREPLGGEPMAGKPPSKPWTNSAFRRKTGLLPPGSPAARPLPEKQGPPERGIPDTKTRGLPRGRKRIRTK